MRLTISDIGKIEEAYRKGEIGYAEYKMLMRLAFSEKEIKPDKLYGVSVDTRFYKWVGDDLIELIKTLGIKKEDKLKKVI